MKAINTNFTKILSEKYDKKWLALNPKQTKVIASGTSLQKVLAIAQKKGYKRPVVTFGFSDYQTIIS